MADSPTTENIQKTAIPLLGQAVNIISDTTSPRDVQQFAEATFKFTAQVLSLLYDNNVATTAAIDAPTTVRATPVRNSASTTPRVIDERRAARPRPRTPATTRPQREPEHYVTQTVIARWLDWYNGESDGNDTIRSEFGRRADCFIAVALLNATGDRATTANVAILTGVAEHNTGRHLNDLCVMDVLRREPTAHGTNWLFSKWTKERVL